MLIRFCIKFIVCLLTIKFAFADIVDVNNEQIKELSKNNIFNEKKHIYLYCTLEKFA